MTAEFVAGDRVELVAMPADPDPVPPGTRGTIRRASVHRWTTGTFVQYDVAWDNGRTLAAIDPPDTLRLVPPEVDGAA